MMKTGLSKLTIVKVVLWICIYFSGLALVYHTRWFIAFMMNSNIRGGVPVNEIPVLWFMVQICSNLIFIYVSFLLIRLIKKYTLAGYFGAESIHVLNGIIIACLGLAFLGAFKTVVTNFSEVHLEEWTTIAAISNLFLRSFTRLLVFSSPQTMYLLIAAILWAVKQFVGVALKVKKENESFI